MVDLLPQTNKDIDNPKKYEVNKAKTLWAIFFVVSTFLFNLYSRSVQ